MEQITYIPRQGSLAATPVKHDQFDLLIVTVGNEPLMFSREQIELLFERREDVAVENDHGLRAAPLPGVFIGGVPVVFDGAVALMPAQPLDQVALGISDPPSQSLASTQAARRERRPSSSGEVVWNGAKAKAAQHSGEVAGDPAAKSKVDLVRVSLRSLGEASIGDVHADLAASEIKISRSDVATNLSYLLKRGEVERTAAGKYRFA